jgi:hypothetical protein
MLWHLEGITTIRGRNLVRGLVEYGELEQRTRHRAPIDNCESLLIVVCIPDLIGNEDANTRLG